MRGIEGYLPRLLAESTRRLNPASTSELIGTLGSLLALVGAVGMTTQDRTEWLAAAADALKGIPVDLLSRAGNVARRDADHPSKVVSVMLAEVEGSWRQRRQDHGDALWLAELSRQPAPEMPPEEIITPEQAKAIREEMGISLTEDAKPARHRGTPRNPTREELAEIAAEIDVPAYANADPVPSIAGLTVAQIFEQRDRLRAMRHDHQDAA